MWTTTALRCGQNKMFSCIVPNRVHICTRVYIYSHSGSNPLTNLWNQSESGLSSSLRVRFSVSWQLLETYVPRRAGYVLYISSYPLFVHTILDTCIVAKLKLTFCLCCFTVILMCELSSKNGVKSCDESVVWVVSMVSRQVKLPPCFLNIFRNLQQVMWVYTGTGITCSHIQVQVIWACDERVQNWIRTCRRIFLSLRSWNSCLEVCCYAYWFYTVVEYSFMKQMVAIALYML